MIDHLHVNSLEKHFVTFPGAGHTKTFTGKRELEQFAALFFADDKFETLVRTNEGRE